MLPKAQTIAEELTAIRRELHACPELGYQEVHTAALIERELQRYGIAYRSKIARTGVVAEISKGSGPTIALRADMDALPIQEATGLPFASQNPGVMHACGHDAHVTMLLGAARLLQESEFSGTVRLLFQPSEEDNSGDPDGWSGARRMLEEGALEGVDRALGLHQAPMLPLGAVSLRDGAVLAAADHFEIIVHGRSAHAGVNPEQGIDAVVIAAELISLLQSIVARKVSPNDQAVISVGSIQGGTGYNIIADRVVLSGTTRALNDTIYRNNISQIKRICDALADLHETRIDFRVIHSVPVTCNDPQVTALVRQAASRVFPAGGIVEVPPMLGGEDFAYISERIPSCFALLGTQDPAGPPYSLHHPEMRLDERALPLGAAFLAQAALVLLAS